MAALLAGLGTGAGIGGMASGATGVGGMIGQFLGSQVMGAANQDTGGMAGQGLQSLYPATANGGQGTQANMPGANPTGTQMPSPSTTSGWGSFGAGYSPLIAHLLGQ